MDKRDPLKITGDLDAVLRVAMKSAKVKPKKAPKKAAKRPKR